MEQIWGFLLAFPSLKVRIETQTQLVMMNDQEFYLRAAPARLIDVINDFLFFFKAVRC